MRTFISDLIPKLQSFSKRLDELALLTNQHWVAIDDLSSNKTVYIFRANNELIISLNGRVEKAKWEYLGNNTLLIDKKEDSYLFKHGFFDENILALKVDSKNEYAFLINENKYEGELNSIDKVIDFLTRRYIEPDTIRIIEGATGIPLKQTKQLIPSKLTLKSYQTDKGIIEMELINQSIPDSIEGLHAFLNGNKAPDGKYKLGFMWYIHIKNGIIDSVSVL